MEKRKSSTRRRGEPPVKKRSVDATSPTPPAPLPNLPEPVDDSLPLTLKDDQELPTVPTQQDRRLSAVQFQSIPESGVLASSIQRSRQKWLVDGVFERYWAKPSKKRIQVDALNPSKESMSKLGSCTLIIEPHFFEATLYTVKERPPAVNTSPITQPPGPPQSSPPDMRYSSFTQPSSLHPHNYNTSASGNALSSHGQQKLSQPSLPAFKESFTQFRPDGPPPLHQNPFATPSTVSVPETGAINDTTLVGGQSQDEKPDQDLFIKLLAMRAASNSELKALMKIVSTGNASQQQLDEFQVHVDSLHEHLSTCNKPSQPVKDPHGVAQSPNARQAPSQHSVASTTTTRPHPVHISELKKPYASTKSTTNPIKQEPSSQYFSHYTQPSRPKNLAAQKPDLSAIVFDLGGSGDRFLFPRFSILEYIPGGTQVIASFLIIRKGDAAVSKGYKDNTSYYQPVTMRLTAQNPRVLEPLARIIAPPDEVKNYMNSVFDKMNRAEKVFLAVQLPRTSESANMETVDRDVPLDSSKLIRSYYSPPDTVVPIRGLSVAQINV